MQPLKIILDTDIGDDVDDALALAFACASPELKLQAVTTTFGNVLARCRQVRTILKIAGRQFADIPVAAGCGSSNAPLPNQDSTSFPEADLLPIDPRHGVDLLIDTIQAANGDVIPVTIGAMTNLAAALTKDPRIARKIPKIVAMAGEFTHEMVEHNIRCDPQAAQTVFSTGIPIDVIPWSIGNTVRFTQQDLERLATADRPMAQYLTLAIRAWQNDPSSRPKLGLPYLFDPMAIATLIRPDLVKWKIGTVSVQLPSGRTCLREHPDGPHRVAFDADRDKCISFFFDRVLAL